MEVMLSWAFIYFSCIHELLVLATDRLAYLCMRILQQIKFIECMSPEFKQNNTRSGIFKTINSLLLSDIENNAVMQMFHFVYEQFFEGTYLSGKLLNKLCTILIIFDWTINPYIRSRINNNLYAKYLIVSSIKSGIYSVELRSFTNYGYSIFS